MLFVEPATQEIEQQCVEQGGHDRVHADQARIIGDEIGRPVHWVETSPENAHQRMLAMGWPQETADGVLAAQAAMMTKPAPPTSTVHDVTGIAARAFRQWVADHADKFRRQPR
ncbi:hypothetical protein [Actinophytocola sp.]|uniref:hypothetical protein n=1 Tax=Actinophytocola sp. TaxID=1872138 RepID=UPI002ED04BE5